MSEREIAPVADALKLVGVVPDFPQPGVVFRDLNPVIANPAAFTTVIDALAATLPAETDLLVAVEARGFLFAAAVGYAQSLGVVPVRKPGKLPEVLHRISYDLEYGSATLELPAVGAVRGSRVVVLDDVLATGGTVAAACELVETVGGEVAGVSVVLELDALGGRRRLTGRNLSSLLVL